MKKTLNFLANFIMFPLWMVYRSVMFILFQKTPGYIEFLDNTEQTSSALYMVLFTAVYSLVFFTVRYFFGSFAAWVTLGSISLMIIAFVAKAVVQQLKKRK